MKLCVTFGLLVLLAAALAAEPEQREKRFLGKLKKIVQKAVEKGKDAIDKATGVITWASQAAKDAYDYGEKAYSKVKGVAGSRMIACFPVNYETAVAKVVEVIDSKATRSVCVKACKAGGKALFGDDLPPEACGPVCNGVLAQLEDKAQGK